jgi:hypothetical protein
MNRRRLLAFLGLAPVAAAVPLVVEAAASKPAMPVGTMRDYYSVEPVSGFTWTDAIATSELPSYSHNVNAPGYSHGYSQYPWQTKANYQIWDGSKFLELESYEGMALYNKMLATMPKVV